LLASNRLVTLTGAGGTGKTRLAGELVTSLGAEFPDGIFWVPVAPIADPELVAADRAEARARDLLDQQFPDKVADLLAKAEVLPRNDGKVDRNADATAVNYGRGEELPTA
jgi:predicted ATPase